MPELPEIIHFKHYLESTALNQKIEDVEVQNIRVLNNCTEEQLKEHVVGTEFKACSNYGKYLFLHTTGSLDVVVHFGMTGRPAYFKIESHKPDHPRVIFHFENGFKLAFDCARMLGKLELTEDREAFISEKDLGPDISSDDFNYDTFQKLMQNRKGMIKSSLMDQHLMAGIGNEQSDEILFQSRIHPKKKVKDLSEKDFKEIYEKMKIVIKKRVECLDHDQKMPDSFLLDYRNEGDECPVCGGSIEKITVGGRSGYFCPGCQDK